MKRLAPLAALTILATPAWAHPGAHLHPHGIDWALVALAASGFAAATATVLATAKVRAKTGGRK